MLKRLNLSIFHPSKIAFFLKDKLSYIFLYIALLSLIASFPMALRLGFTNEMPLSIKQDLKGLIVQSNTMCEINNGIIQNCDNKTISYQGMVIRLGGIPESNQYQMIFESDQIAFYLDTILIRNYSYETLGIENLDFQFENQSDTDSFYHATDVLFNDIKPIVVFTGTLMLFLSNLILYLLLALIMSFLYGIRPEKLKFKYRFIMSIYALTSYFVVILIGELYGLGILSYFALVLPYIYMSIAFKGLLRMSKIVVVKKDDEENKD